MKNISHLERIVLRLDPNELRRWHLRLLQRFGGAVSCPVGVVWGKVQAPCPANAQLIFELERIFHRMPDMGLMQPVDKSEFAEFNGALDAKILVVDLCGDAFQTIATVKTLKFEGVCGDGAALQALLNGLPPRLELGASSAQPGTEHPGVILKAMNDVMVRSITFVLAVASGQALSAAPLNRSNTPKSFGYHALFSAKAVARAVALRLYHLCYNTPHWKVGWRIAEDFDFIETGTHPEAGWKVIPDDGYRFYADPFPLVRQGQSQIFAEDFSHKLGRGVICAFEILANGNLSAARPVLDTGSHLSYPLVFEAEGEVWMVPENSTQLKLELYRAARYPDTWVKEAVLLDNQDISDATLFEHEGRWWMMASVRDEGGGYSDTLHIWSAPNFRGPWLPHAHTPALIDASCARPAGHMISRGGRLLRPVQDCSRFYGQSVKMMEVIQLDDAGFAQKPVATLGAGPKWSGRRLHTFNRSGSIEAIDGSSVGKKYF